MDDDRYSLRYRRYRDPMRGLAIGMLLIGLAFAIFYGLGDFFLTFLFVGLACSALLGMISTFHPRKIYSGLQGFIWFLGLAILFLPGVAFWPWILLVCGVSAIVGALAGPIIARIEGMGSMDAASLANRQPQPTDQQPYQPYEQGYQPPPQAPGAYQEGGEVYDQPPQQQQPQYEQPQVQYPQEQEMLSQH